MYQPPNQETGHQLWSVILDVRPSLRPDGNEREEYAMEVSDIHMV